MCYYCVELIFIIHNVKTGFKRMVPRKVSSLHTRQGETRAATIFLLFDSMRFDFLPLRFDFFDSIHWSDEKQ